MQTASEIQAEHVLLAAAVILAAGSVLGYLARRLRVPDIVLFLIAGIVLGPELLGVLNIPATSTLFWVIIIFAVSYILFDGGASLRLKVLGRVWISLAIIVTIGMLITAFVIGITAQWVLGIPVTVGILLGAAMASTDPATLVPVFRQVNVRGKVSQFVVSESALNDPMGVIITLGFLGLVVGGNGGEQISIGSVVLDLVFQAGLGVVAGVVLGCLGSFFVAHERYGFLMEYLPLVTLIAVVGGYLSAVGLHASGFMAAFVAGVVMGNMDYFGLQMPSTDRRRFDDFVGTTSLISRMFIFILLGSQVDLALIARYWWQGLVVVVVFMFVARPLTVLLSTAADRRARWTWRELCFVAWTRETGVIPGALASILVATHAPHADVLAAIIFMSILITIIVQATTAKWVAARLGLLVGDSRPKPQQIRATEEHQQQTLTLHAVKIHDDEALVSARNRQVPSAGSHTER
jgi:cell volume regulation protein A